jgi:F0F1-type ATP synthase delta subunit
MVLKSSVSVDIKIPDIVFGMPEVRRILREIEDVEKRQLESKIRVNATNDKLDCSRSLELLISQNKLDVNNAQDLSRLQDFLQDLEKTAPIVNVSFAGDPSAAFLVKIVDWFRRNADPRTMVKWGLQPEITAGCIIRTHNKVFDLSLRNNFAQKRSILSDLLEVKNER